MDFADIRTVPPARVSRQAWRPRQWRGNQDGFTLIDNILTLGIMMFTMMALVGLLGTVISANNGNKKRTTGITLAENKIAEVRRNGYDSTVPLNTTVTVTEDYNTMTGYPNFKRVTATQDGVPSAGMQTITVTVSWDNDKKSFVKSTQVAQ